MIGDRSVRTAPRIQVRGAGGRTAVERGRGELARGRAQLADGPVDDARESLLLAASLLAAGAPEEAESARLAAADAAWAAGDLTACLTALGEDENEGENEGEHEGGGENEGGGEGGGEGEDENENGRDTARAGTRPTGPTERVPDRRGASQASGAAGGEGAVGCCVAGVVEQGPCRVMQGVSEKAGVGRGVVAVGCCVAGAVEQGPCGVMQGLSEVPRAAGGEGAADCRVAGPVKQGPCAATQGAPQAPVPAAEPGSASVPVPAAEPGSASVPAPAAEPGSAFAPAPAAEPGSAFAPAPSAGPGPTPAAVTADYRVGLRALLQRRLDRAVQPLRRVVDLAQADERPEHLLRSATAALLLGDVVVARRAGARALAAARNRDSAALESRALEYLAYAELRAGRHAQARTHAEEGVRAAHRAGRRNTAAHHQAMLALAASIVGETAAVADHAAAALTTARRHGLAQAATLAEWAVARADLGCGRPLDAADRLGPLVLPGPRRGHFAVWMLAVPCFVEAAVLAGRPDDARAVVDDFARWAGFGADPHAPAQLARCHALLAPADRADHVDGLYLRALALHDETGGDFERARTELLHGKWLRRRRRLREARARLGAALVGFERCGARVWAEQTHGELRANGAAARQDADADTAGALARLTPQQLRIARHVAEGATNREVALRLAVSTRTVDYHLRNVFAVLGVRSRIELARMVDQEGG
ncbi:LuxR C-terminal-related transcriptional regulator [Streptomyces sp. NPDC050803]|uniref:helix-turn-helix transcriptional regulator n=1 Tax=Streptomyces sp. NPDC050803 TaxID=3154635 RepID=UPI0034325F91